MNNLFAVFIGGAGKGPAGTAGAKDATGGGNGRVTTVSVV
jgi:hypothetical protein